MYGIRTYVLKSREANTLRSAQKREAETSTRGEMSLAQ